MSAASEAGGFVAPDIPSEAIVNTCIKCGLCLPTCPTYALKRDERSSPRGRINLIQSVLEGKLPIDDATFEAQMSECLGCRNCEPVCPSGVAFGSLLEDARAQIATRKGSEIDARCLRFAHDAALGNAGVLRAVSAVVAFLEISGVRAAVRRSGILHALGLARLESLLPAPRGAPFVADGQSWPADGAQAGSVALLTGCIMSALFGDVHRATVRVLTRSAWTVEVPAGQGCCGALHLHAGYKDAARAYARRNIAAFESSSADYVAVNAAGCGAAMKEYGALLADDPLWSGRAAAFSARVRDAVELVRVPVERPGARATPIEVVYQDACHLAHAQGVKAQPRRAIDAVAGVERREMAHADRCCGSAGVYNLTHPQEADALADQRIASAIDAGAQRILTANPGCEIHLSAAARRSGGPPIQHIMEFLDDPDADPRPVIDRRHAVAGGLLLGAGAIVLVGAVILALRRNR
jgi:glycolate oxidase iron-sulfur subunit